MTLKAGNAAVDLVYHRCQAQRSALATMGNQYLLLPKHSEASKRKALLFFVYDHGVPEKWRPCICRLLLPLYLYRPTEVGVVVVKDAQKKMAFNLESNAGLFFSIVFLYFKRELWSKINKGSALVHPLCWQVLIFADEKPREKSDNGAKTSLPVSCRQWLRSTHNHITCATIFLSLSI